jgi:hypothetical protein
MSKMDTDKCWEAVGMISELLNEKFEELSTAEHLFVLHMSITAITEGVIKVEREAVAE